MQNQNDLHAIRASQLTVDGCDETNNFVAGGDRAPYAVFDSGLSDCVSVDFSERKHAEQLRIAILKGENSEVVRNAYLTGQAPLDAVVLHAYKLHIGKYQSCTKSAPVLPEGNSGIKVQIKQVQAQRVAKFEVEILSGYRTGNLLCHGQSSHPLRWSSADEARQWLTDTGYTVIDGHRKLELATCNFRSKDMPFSEVLKVQQEVDRLLKIAGWVQPFAGNAGTPRFYFGSFHNNYGRFIGLWARDFHLGAVALYDPSEGAQEIADQILAKVALHSGPFPWTIIDCSYAEKIVAWPGNALMQIKFLIGRRILGELSAHNAEEAMSIWNAQNRKTS